MSTTVDGDRAPTSLVGGFASPGTVAPRVANQAKRPRIAIFIVAYNAVSTLRAVLDRIPESIWDKVEEVFVFDDSSKDDTFLVGMGYKAHHSKAKLSIYKNEQNLGYGGNQIRGYQYAIEKGYDIVALLHGDAQYAPESLPELLAPLEAGQADAVFGSRMLTKGGALAGGMPLYKFVGNRLLTGFENTLLGMSLSEFHSGYRLYSCKALQQVPFHKNTHDFHFDTQIIIQLQAAGLKIVEVPIPTYYGDEICAVNGLRYARDVVRSVLEYRLHDAGLRRQPEYEVRPNYTLKRSARSSHSQVLGRIGALPQRVLDVGCGTGELSGRLRAEGHYVVGIDAQPPQHELDEFYQADLEGRWPLTSERVFDTILLADVLEHVADPKALLTRARQHLSQDGRVIISLPNVAHWSVRAQMLCGRFEYTNKGILDRTHLRFFTRRSARALVEDVGLKVVSHSATPVPWENVIPAALSAVRDGMERIDHSMARLHPNLFAYQHIFELAIG